MPKIPNIPIIYASTSGNVEIVCQTIAEGLNSQGIQTTLLRAEITPFSIIQRHDLLIFSTSTWEHGRVNPFFDKLISEIQESDMTGKKASFVGLGDKRYEPVYFAEGIEHLRRKFMRQGGQQIHTTLKIDNEPYDLLDTAVADWISYLTKEIQIIYK